MLGESPCIVINFSELRAEQYIVYIQGDSPITLTSPSLYFPLIIYLQLNN